MTVPARLKLKLRLRLRLRFRLRLRLRLRLSKYLVVFIYKLLMPIRAKSES